MENVIFDVQPRGLKGAFILEAETTKYKKPDRFKMKKVLGEIFDTRIEQALFSVMIPDISFMVPEMFKVGAWASYEVGGQVTFQGSSTIDFGVTLEVSDKGNLHVNAGNPRSSNVTGLNGVVDEVFDLKAFSGQAQLSLYSQTKLYFGIEIEEIGRVDIAFIYKMPQLSYRLEPGYGKYPNPETILIIFLIRR